MNNFQRINSISNAHVGQEFENIALAYFQQQGITLFSKFSLPIGVNTMKKKRIFDLGNTSTKVVVECKSHKWTSSDNVPSAKLTVWNEAMYYFYLTPANYRKIFFILKDYSVKRNETLGEYYIRTHFHLIPNDVEIMEYDNVKGTIELLKNISV